MAFGELLNMIHCAAANNIRKEKRWCCSQGTVILRTIPKRDLQVHYHSTSWRLLNTTNPIAQYILGIVCWTMLTHHRLLAVANTSYCTSQAHGVMSNECTTAVTISTWSQCAVNCSKPFTLRLPCFTDGSSQDWKAPMKWWLLPWNQMTCVVVVSVQFGLFSMNRQEEENVDECMKSMPYRANPHEQCWLRIIRFSNLSIHHQIHGANIEHSLQWIATTKWLQAWNSMETIRIISWQGFGLFVHQVVIYQDLHELGNSAISKNNARLGCMVHWIRIAIAESCTLACCCDKSKATTLTQMANTHNSWIKVMWLFLFWCTANKRAHARMHASSKDTSAMQTQFRARAEKKKALRRNRNWCTPTPPPTMHGLALPWALLLGGSD